MPVRNAIWKVGAEPQPLGEGRLPSERTLEDMIVSAPSILSDEWMLIGRQEQTGTGGIIDLLAIAPDGTLVLIELKRARTPREVVAQALDYACWVETLKAEDIAAAYARFRPGRNLSDDFEARFGYPLDEDTLNDSHQIVVVAASLDSSTERIVQYLNARDIPINVLFFQVFDNAGEQLLCRTWMIDPGETQVNVAAAGRGDKEPWNGEFYASFGHGQGRDWEEARQYGFISGGGGTWYSNTLSLLGTGDRVWVKAPGYGFVGAGEVTGPRQSINEFRIDGRPAIEVLSGAHYHREHADDPDRCEYFVPVKWLQTLPLDQAIDEIGLFGNQNTVCKPRTPKWRTTVERLKQALPRHDDATT
ncbi:endonuclease NucS domain-containing protein [Algiphilus sp.]|uniref:endonuclease NucS domain-containing protein n=1 Tax=Algiphilus sp. TaxID=1872431 RepID=UPI003C63CDB2